MLARIAIAAVLAASAATASAADQLPDPAEGYLCCNMRTDGHWISDINYDASGKHVIPAGTPVKATGFGRWRVLVEVDGVKEELGNDYSRDLDMTAFARRYVVAEDPTKKLARAPAKVREAVKTARVTKGMTREQVLMAVGYPVSRSTPRLEADTWHFWLTSRGEFQVHFEGNVVKSITAENEETRDKVVLK